MKNPSRVYRDAIYEQFARIGKAVASPKRLERLDLLCQGEKTVEMLRARSYNAVRIEEGIQDFRAMGFSITAAEEAFYHPFANVSFAKFPLRRFDLNPYGLARQPRNGNDRS